MGEDKTNYSVAKEIFSWLKEIVIIILIFYLINTFLFQNTRVIGQSMEPTLQDGNAVIINKFTYRLKQPSKGDIIVFPYRGDHSRNYIKRIIGVPGDEINIKDSKVYVNSIEIEEVYIKENMELRGNILFPFTVPDDEYFVMGDNRNNSSDSRYKDVGTVPGEDIIGKASLRIWPLNELGIVK